MGADPKRAPAASAAASPEADAALRQTMTWFERAVVGLNLCPFAKAVHAKGQIRWVVSAAREPGELLAALVDEMLALAAADANSIDTTLLVHPWVLRDFRAFNDFLDIADAALERLGLAGTLQVASFHPNYRFAGTAPGEVTNLSNRSPFPTLHLLRESSVERAVAAVPDAMTIPERNMATLRALAPALRREIFGARARQRARRGRTPAD